MSIKNMAYNLLIFLIRFLNTLIPKKESIVIASADGFRGNAKAFVEYVTNKYNYNISFVAVNDRSEKSYKLYGLPYIKVYSWRFWYMVFTSRWLISTHYELGRFKAFKHQYYINLWHGPMVKKVGNMWSADEGRKIAGVADRADVIACPSEFYRGIMALCFNIPFWKVTITGSPRNDWLHDSVRANRTLRQVLSNNFSKTILYCPTYRNYKNEKSMRSYSQEKENLMIDSSWSYDKFKMKYLTPEFKNFLEDNNLLFVVKLHPFEEAQLTDKELSGSGRIKYLTGNMLDKKKIDLYEILAGFDLLITDYSSIYIDYLITQKPVIFMIDDLDEYNSKRGFVLDMYEELTPGPKVYSSPDLIKEIILCLSDNPYFKVERKKVNTLLNNAIPPYSQNIINLMQK